MKYRGLSALVLAGALLLGGCGDDKRPTVISVEDDTKAAEQAIAYFESTLRKQGFEVSADDDDDDTDLEFESQECREYEELFGGEDVPLPGSTAERTSESFERGAFAAGSMLESAEATVDLLKSPDDVKKVFALLRDERFGRCLEEAYALDIKQGEESGETEGLTFSDPEIKVADVSDVGDDGLLLTMTTSLELDEESIPLGFVIQFAAKDRAAAFVMLSTVNASTPRVQAGPLLEGMLQDLTG